MRVSRYSSAGIEGEWQPGSHQRVLRNKLGIARKREMDQAERDALLAVQMRYVSLIETTTRFTDKLLCQIHRDWLGDIYEWAGKYRTVDISKGGFTWPGAFTVPDNMARFSQDMLARYTPCSGMTKDDICHALAVIHAEFLLIHPFREGNGRLARLLADLMVAQTNHPLPLYRFQGRGATTYRIRYLRAVQQGYLMRYAELEDFFDEALRLGEAAES